MLSMYDIKDEDIDSLFDQSQLSAVAQSAQLQMQLPVVELMKVCGCYFYCWLYMLISNYCTLICIFDISFSFSKFPLFIKRKYISCHVSQTILVVIITMFCFHFSTLSFHGLHSNTSQFMLVNKHLSFIFISIFTLYMIFFLFFMATNRLEFVLNCLFFTLRPYHEVCM